MITRTVVILMMWTVSTVLTNHGWEKIKLADDKPSLRAMVTEIAELHCCFEVVGVNLIPIWVVTVGRYNGTNVTMETREVPLEERITSEKKPVSKDRFPCFELKVRQVTVNDTGLYRCLLNHTSLPKQVYTHGTFLQVYRPMEKFLNISESAKNRIITFEGVLLLICVLGPGLFALIKTKRLNELERRKNKGEEENIYEGLNLEDCNSTYHQIQRSQVQGPYQDVDNVRDEDIQLEKP
ncbi:hypothetical protein AGOR_G00212360 [Albula goreensis]|uniref:CD79a n=1 Tax=Albula goreensis TaxID=1534307 RepID=A0A8T3CUV3_9TELE|nr:hypothetical protein AGOR_G00212360 [Albula goreensis]